MEATAATAAAVAVSHVRVGSDIPERKNVKGRGRPRAGERRKRDVDRTREKQRTPGI